MALFFWPEGRPLHAKLASIPGAIQFYERVFFQPIWGLLALGTLILFGIGWRPRFTGPLLVLFLLPLAFLRGAMVSRQMLLLSFLAFSLLRSDVRLSLGGNPSELISPGPMWPIRLVQLQLSVTYIVNALVKLHADYLSGEVLVALSQRFQHFLVDLSDGALHMGPLAIPVWLCACGTVAIELAVGICLWIPRLRIPAVALGVAFHTSLMFVIAIGWLDWTCMLLYLAFLLPFEQTQ